ncbi:MAG: DNA polymerase III subunit delta [Acidobacteria bacterium]|nr:MAG: DNA polymerase III subunit delta [Acidobacteriota bacterium]
MKTLTPQAFMRAVERGQVEPLYLFTGPLPGGRRRPVAQEPERYLQRRAVETLIERALDPASRAFNLSLFSAGETPLARIIDVARQLPVSSARRLVVVRELDRAFKPVRQSDSGSPRAAASTPGERELIEYLKHPSETTTIVFFYDAPDRRRNVTHALLKTCTIVEFRPLDEREAAAWAREYLRQYGCAADDGALGMLIGRVGSDLRSLVNELNKLIAYVRQGPISRADVEILVPYLREHSNFELEAPLLERDRGRALKLLRRQLEAGQPPVFLLGVISQLYRRMMLAKDLMAQGVPNSEVARAVGLPPHRVGRLNEHVRRLSIREISRGIERIAAVDRALKNSLGPPALQLELLVYELCSPHTDRQR